MTSIDDMLAEIRDIRQGHYTAALFAHLCRSLRREHSRVSCERPARNFRSVSRQRSMIIWEGEVASSLQGPFVRRLNKGITTTSASACISF